MQKATRSGNFEKFNISRFCNILFAFYLCPVSINTKY